jgi:hypothetical protein
MDVLDQVLPHARDLLARVDEALIGKGAPVDHPIWPLLRRVGSLPSEAIEFAAGFDVNALDTAAAEIRVRAEQYANLGEDVELDEWTGPAAATFAAHWRRLRDHLGTDEGLVGRLLATAEHLERLAVWGRSLRREVAYAAATALGSMEAVTLHRQEPGTEAAVAAARIGQVLLAPVADALPHVEALLDVSLAELQYRPPPATAAGTPTETSVPI